ncbi:hypothetical protein GOV03_02215 [Candidatus Woesearchaeota archaeon]|nr:hypothetical protein [Candidatus Woesearchaeota archaeon]
MEKFQLLREEALKNYRIADHMLTVTYPLLQDTKLLVGVTENLFLALTQAMTSILTHERIFKLVPSFNDTFADKIQTLHRKRSRYQIDQEFFKLMLELKETLQLHKQSPIEFRKKDRFIICTKNYKVKAITANQLKDYLKTTREFLNLMNKITSRNKIIFKQD